MSSLILPSRLTRQPQQAPQIDLSNPLTRGLRVVQVGAQNYPFQNVNGVTSVATPAGMARKFSGASQYLTAANDFISPTSLTFLSIVRFDSLPASTAIMSIGAATNDRVLLYVANNRLALYSGAGGGFGQAIAPSDVLLTTGRQYVVGGRVSATNSRDVWLDGVKLFSDATSIAPAPCNRAVVGAYWTSGAASLYLPGAVSLALAWDRPLSDAEMKAASDNPWQLFKAPARNMWAVAASAPAGNTYPLPAAQGSYTITGNDAGLRVSRRLMAAGAAYSLTGNPASLKVARRLTAAPGSYSIAGSAANLVKGTAPRALDAVGGNYIITGRPAALRVARRLLAAPGSYVLTGVSTGAPVSGSVPRYAGFALMGLSSARNTADLGQPWIRQTSNLGPDRIQQTADLI